MLDAQILGALRQLNHGAFLAVLVLLGALGARLAWIVLLHLWYRSRGLAREAALRAAAPPPDDRLPHVLVQVATRNEARVIEATLAAVAALDWPRDRLHIQVVDNSDEAELAVTDAAVAELCRRGIDARLVHRRGNAGFKVGNLVAGLLLSDHEYVAVLDADCRPPADFLRRAVPPLIADPHLGFCQARWDFLNGGENRLTRIQQALLDAFFGVEQTARFWSGQVVLFCGTSAVWRRAAIDDAGGWQSDTLLEDHDLSYRAQSRGWRGAFLVGLAVPGELPATIDAWMIQQFRWNKGFAQVARKALPVIRRGRLSIGAKLQAIWYLAGTLFGPLLGLAVALGAVDLALGTGLTPLALGLIGLSILLANGAGLAQLWLGQRLLRQARGWRAFLALAPAAWLFIYSVVASVRGIAEALRGKTSDFIPTPKRGLPAGVATERAERPHDA